MNVNVKLSLSDDERRALASYLAGKPVKRLATRAEVNAVVAELLAISISDTPIPRTRAPVEAAAEPQARGTGYRDIDDPIPEPQGFCSDDCCTRNHLLQSRVNRLQHRLDTNR